MPNNGKGKGVKEKFEVAAGKLKIRQRKNKSCQYERLHMSGKPASTIFIAALSRVMLGDRSKLSPEQTGDVQTLIIVSVSLALLANAYPETNGKMQKFLRGWATPTMSMKFRSIYLWLP